MNAATRYPFPGVPAIIDGSEAVAHVETRIAEGCCAYPITPSTTMASLFQAAVADGRHVFVEKPMALTKAAIADRRSHGWPPRHSPSRAMIIGVKPDVGDRKKIDDRTARLRCLPAAHTPRYA